MEVYVNSGSFDDAIAAFPVIRDHLADYGEVELRRLLEGGEANDQVHGRYHAKRDHALLQAACHRALGPDFDMMPYRNMGASWK